MTDPPGEVDAQDDRANRIIVARGLECLGEIVRGGHRGAGQADTLGLAAYDFAVAIDDGDLILGAEAGKHARMHIVGEVDHPMVPAAVMLHTVGELILILEAFDHMHLEAEAGVERGLIDDRAHLIGGDAALAGDLTDDLIEHAADQRVILFMLTGGKILFGKDIGRALVFPQRREVRPHPKPIQRGACKNLADADADQVELALGH